MKRGWMLIAGMALTILFTASAGLAQMGCGMMVAGGHGGHSKEEARETHGQAGSMDCPMMGGACERWMRSPTFYLDRVEDLGLSEEQAVSLRTIRRIYEKEDAARREDVQQAERGVEEEGGADDTYGIQGRGPKGGGLLSGARRRWGYGNDPDRGGLSQSPPPDPDGAGRRWALRHRR